jgi:hypothetical protein
MADMIKWLFEDTDSPREMWIGIGIYAEGVCVGVLCCLMAVGVRMAFGGIT